MSDETSFVHQRAKIEIPENLYLRHRACLGGGSVVDSLGSSEIEERATIAQGAYPCAVPHDFDARITFLITDRIRITAGAFWGARAFQLCQECISVKMLS